LRLADSAICDPLWENRPNHWLLQNKIEARKVDKVDIVITAVGDQNFFLTKLQ